VIPKKYHVKFVIKLVKLNVQNVTAEARKSALIVMEAGNKGVVIAAEVEKKNVVGAVAVGERNVIPVMDRVKIQMAIAVLHVAALVKTGV
jgi:hypothetical protein